MPQSDTPPAPFSAGSSFLDTPARRTSTDSEPDFPYPRRGPLTAPSSPVWRRHRLLNIGIESPPDDAAAPFSHSISPPVSYGAISTLPSRIQGPWPRPSRIPRPSLTSLKHPSTTSLAAPALHRTRSLSSLFTTFRRPISAYDAADSYGPQTVEEEEGSRVNGIRVWYSSFSSIDWLHDSIKDSLRTLRLRRRRSLRGRLTNSFDRSIGWIVVTVVGILTALIAYVIVRSEQWLFDIKEGFCGDAWWKAKRFCCPMNEDTIGIPIFAGFNRHTQVCSAWKTWGDVFGPRNDGSSPWIRVEDQVVEYLAYTVVALSLACLSSILTIRLTASTSFATRKDSGVLSSNFDAKNKKSPQSLSDPRRKVMYFAAGSGIPEIKTILSGFVIHGYLGGRTLFTKSLGLALSVASGLSLGKEGPFVHIASCVGNIVSRWFSKYEMNEGKRREILSAASAAGVAVAFGAPVGGVLFSLEEVSYFFPPKVMWRSFFCAMIAAMTLKLLDPFGTGKLVLFQVTYDKDWHASEIPVFLILGLFGGIYGAYFSKLNYRWSRDVRNKTWLKTHPASEVLLVTFVTTVVCFLNPYTRMGGTELVYNLFAECRSGDWHEGLCVSRPEDIMSVARAIAIALVAKGALTIVTFGIKVPAGIFVPTLGVGACFGRIIGLCVQYLQLRHPDWSLFRSCHGAEDCVVPGLYAMVGAAATLSGVTRTTVSLAVIMFELTGTLTYVVPVALAILVAKTVADALEPKGIYDLVIELSQLPYLDHKQEYLWGGHQLSDVIDPDVHAIRADKVNTVKSLRDKLQEVVDADGGFPILTREEGGLKMIGYIGVSELEHALTLVADEANSTCHFHPSMIPRQDYLSSSISSMYADVPVGPDPFDFTVYMDQAPLTTQANAPLELIQMYFVKLGARYIVVTNMDGFYQGVIDKKQWLAFLSELH